MKIAILGGSFDPPHIGHFLVIRQILDYRADIDKIILVPTYQHQWKPHFTTTKDRLHMLSSLVLEKTEVSTIEVSRKGISYTIDTVQEIKKQTGAEIYWIVGSDILFEYDKWDKKEDLEKEMTFLVFPRDPYHIPKNIPKGFEVFSHKNLITTNISSTNIRKRIQEGKSIENLVPQKVAKYILKKNLYKI